LSIKEGDDGKILLHCFAGCDVASVVAAVGLEMSDLYPEKIIAHGKAMRRPWSAADLIGLLDHETLILFIIAADQIEGKTLDEATMQRLQVVRARISAIAESIR
jgi:hypothetical protein